MPAFDEDPEAKTLPFPPLTTAHILHCSYHHWHARYRSISPKARLIPLTKPFLDYLRADGIILPPEPNESSADDGWDDSDDEAEQPSDPSTAWPDIHARIQKTISTLDGAVAPKLNWSSPKDATWINATNTQECRSANDIYLMLKSSDFVTHDLEHAFDDCADVSSTSTKPDQIPYHLVLRKYFNMNPSVEFRCFVRRRVLLGICQRDLNHFDFLFELRPTLVALIHRFFAQHLRDSFDDDSFAFDVYVPNPYTRVWLVDVNPWALRTDPLLFSWGELLSMPEPDEPDESLSDDDADDVVVRVPFRPREADDIVESSDAASDAEVSASGGLAEAFEGLTIRPLELRLIKKSDPEAYTFNTPQYSAHKLPRDVVDASQSGPGPMQDFATQWKDALEKRERGEDEDNESDGDEHEGVTNNA